MNTVSPSQWVAGAAGLAAALVGLRVFWMWHEAGWSRANFSPDYGGPVAPLAAALFIVMGGAIASVALTTNKTLARRVTGGASLTTLLSAGVVAARGRFTSPDFAQWQAGAPEFIGPLPVGNMSPVAAFGFTLAALGLLARERMFPGRVRNWGLEWILPLIGGALSSLVLLAYASGPPLMAGERLIPLALPAAVGLLLLNGGLLILGAPASFRGALFPARTEDEGVLWRHRVLAGLGVAVLFGFATLAYVRREQSAARQETHERLDAIARLKAAQIEAWRGDRLREAEFLHKTRALIRDVLDLLENPADPAVRDKVVTWMENIRRADRYADIHIFGAEGAALLAVPESARRGRPEDLPAALRGDRVLVTDVHRNSLDPAPHLDLIVPIRDDSRPHKDAQAALVLRIDPRLSLFPLVTQWPVPTASAEMILIRAEGRDIRYLSDLRGGLPNARARSVPWAGDAPPGDGPPLLLEGRDHRGVLTLSALRRVGDSPWFVEAKIDQAEAYAPVRVAALQSGLLAGLLLAGMGMSAAYLGRARRAEHLTKMLDAERKRVVLADRLSVIADNANDVILLFDRNMKIVEANDRVRTMYGRSPDEMRRLSLGDLHPPETRPMTAGIFARIFGGAPDVFETRHMRADGGLVPVEVSAQPVSLGGERFQLAIVRDITQRKAQQTEIDRLNRLYTALSEVSASIVRAGKEPFLDEACRALSARGGFPMAWIGQIAPSTGLVQPVAQFGDPGGFLDRLRELTSDSLEGRGPAGRAIADNATFSCQDHIENPRARPWREAAASFGFAASIALPIRIDGRPWGALCVYATEANAFGKAEVALLEDVAEAIALGIEHGERETRRVEAQETSRISEERLRLALSAARQGLYDVDYRTGAAIVSPEYAMILGADPETFRETIDSWRERVHPADLEATERAHQDYVEGRISEYSVEFRMRTASGAYKWLLSLGRIVERGPDGEPWRMLGTITDISERKRHEAQTIAVQNRLNATLNAIPDLMFEMGLNGEYHSVHSPRSDLLAAPAQELSGKTVRDVLPERAAEAVIAAIREAHETGLSLGRQFELTLPPPGGDCWFELSVSRGPAGPDLDPRFVVLSRDITRRKSAETALRGSLHEKEALLKEVHHRVKNNLQVITSLLRLEAHRDVAPGTRNVLKEMQGRIRSMALIHETLYRTGDFARIDVGEYLRQLGQQLFRAQNSEPSRVRLKMDLAEILLDLDHAIPCGLIANELLSNSLKYAFPEGRAGDVWLRLSRGEDSSVVLRVEDTGVGLAPDFETRRTGSLGLQLVGDLSRQLGGRLEIGGGGPGARFTITFPGPQSQTGETTRGG